MTTEQLIEAILFVSDSPVTASEMSEVLEVPRSEIDDALDAMTTRFAEERGLDLENVAGGWRLSTKPGAHKYLERFAATERARRLSNAAVETLAVVAYKQPVSRGQVGEIRGVDSEHAIRTLERRDLVAEVGRAPGPGQAVLYGTTPLFLEKMGIASLAELPPLADHVPPAGIMETLEMPMRPDGSDGSLSD